MPRDGRIVAVLGPTNTGKTHLAVERMLGHPSGMIGLPLRLLAREIYDRVAAQRGQRNVALITGEEKIVPPHPHYYVCTVESMPLERSVDFLAVDEIQLCADAERGHVFTDRLLRARGERETMFLGAETMRPIIRRLLPDAEYISRPRFSQLSYAGERKLSRLPRRSAVVAFSAADVYALAELMRRQRGGAAVVLGALSPRRSRSTNRARSITWWRRTPSAWASTWTSTMSRSRACASSTACTCGGCRRRRSARSPAAPAGT